MFCLKFSAKRKSKILFFKGLGSIFNAIFMHDFERMWPKLRLILKVPKKLWKLSILDFVSSFLQTKKVKDHVTEFEIDIKRTKKTLKINYELRFWFKFSANKSRRSCFSSVPGSIFNAIVCRHRVVVMLVK